MIAKELLKILEAHKNIIDGGTEILISSVPHPRKGGTGIYFVNDAIFDPTQNILTIFVDKEMTLYEMKQYSDE